MKTYINLLKNDTNFRILSIVQLICYFAAWFSHTGIFTLLIDLKAPVWAITISAAMAFLPGVFLAPFSGVFIDKFSPKPMLVIMLIIEAISALMLLFINTLDLLWLLLILIFIRMGVGGVYFQVEMSLLPKILKKQDLKTANEIHSVIWAVAYTAGMSMAGVFIHFFGIKTAFLFDFSLYIVGFYFLLKLDVKSIKQKITEPVFQMLSKGLKYIKNNKLILHLMLIHAFVGLTAYDALIALLADYKYKFILSASLAIGLTNASRAFALMVGPAILGKFINNTNLHYFYVLQGAGIILWSFLQNNFYIGFMGMFCAGFFTSTLWSYTYTLIQQNCDENFYGRVIAYNDMLFLGASALMSLFIGFLFNYGVSLRMITILMGLAFVVGAIYYYKIFKKYEIK
ncbi:MFS transporter [Campylobacter pinnipediorum]|uniref:MFS transporter n=1 Tax=Campylobacter pinnipediorum subsp. pinnipediorum TaxID=1660067 RepID=A0AAX0LAU7_9BACT|nr:MFS transporter [Campylobacter pinnipediorum]AQW81003.1 H+ antiporter protein, major facilitator superfamily [Campylobacter pinnipediorum subsp. pinnipediorum]OPA77118.1 MFS transporter [Campylobacter pinnipediorum subsp. pinnipediorum]OPA78905.1 MFS transporter [Campylobacter pinnipediorum subsp. pinnipediorum]